MTWARALGEFGATLVFAGSFPGRTETMPLAIYSSVASGTEMGLRTSVALAVVLVVVSFLVIIIAKHLMRHDLSPDMG
jgi:molybdate transport system permease protein